MSNNVFSWRRFTLLFRQHLIHNSQLMLLSIMAYVGVIFIVLSLSQFANALQPNDLTIFQALLIVLVTVFGVLYVGHSFPAFRSKESTITYLMLPASALEKFLFEVVIRIGLILLLLPILYWITFNLQGYMFGMFTDLPFQPIGIEYLVKLEIPDGYLVLIYALIAGGVLFVLAVVFTGAAMFTKQPLVKTLFGVALILMFFFGYSYIVVEHLGLGRYNPPDSMVLVPLDEDSALQAVTIWLFSGAAVMLFVAFRKLKEREV